jgi:hypothetical protein
MHLQPASVCMYVSVYVCVCMYVCMCILTEMRASETSLPLICMDTRQGHADCQSVTVFYSNAEYGHGQCHGLSRYFIRSNAEYGHGQCHGLSRYFIRSNAEYGHGRCHGLSRYPLVNAQVVVPCDCSLQYLRKKRLQAEGLCVLQRLATDPPQCGPTEKLRAAYT